MSVRCTQKRDGRLVTATALMRIKKAERKYNTHFNLSEYPGTTKIRCAEANDIVDIIEQRCQKMIPLWQRPLQLLRKLFT